MSSRHLYGTPRLAPRRARRAFTVVELAITIAVLAVLGSVLTTCLEGMRDATLAGSVQSKQIEAGQRALRWIIQDLRRSGQVVVEGRGYPYLFEDGAAAGDFVDHAHAPAATTATPGQPDFGPSREIVFLLPRDEDTWGPPWVEGVPDGIPDLDENARLQWGDAEVSYVLVTGADGINALQRRVGAVLDRPVARFVERVVFDDVGTDVTLPVDSVRVRIFLRQRDSGGRIHRHLAEATVRLRNGI